MSTHDVVLPEPAVTGDDGDWDEKAKTAMEAWELGRRTMIPRPLRPIPGSRLAERQAFPPTA